MVYSLFDITLFRSIYCLIMFVLYFTAFLTFLLLIHISYECFTSHFKSYIFLVHVHSLKHCFELFIHSLISPFHNILGSLMLITDWLLWQFLPKNESGEL